MTRPHPFFFVVLVLLGVGVVVSAFTETRTPSWALQSGVVYHAEITAAVTLAGYLVVVLLWLAWRGRTFSKVELPIGSLEAPDAGALDAAAEDFAEFKKAANERLTLLEGIVEELARR